MILLRDADPPEALLIRRHEKSGFFGGAYAFPGGKLDAVDCATATLARLPLGSIQRCADLMEPTPGRELSPAQAAGLYVAACRELFEEAGVLLAYTEDGAPWQPDQISGRSGFLSSSTTDLRRRIHGGELGFGDMLADLGVHLDLDGLAYWSHWVTPSLEPRRFDTRFFVARMPAGQEASVDNHETTEQRWLTPAAALAACTAGEIILPPPTLRTLEDLDAVSGTGVAADVEAVLEVARQRPVLAILPKIANTPDGPGIVLPWDPLYGTAEGEALSPEPDYPSDWQRGPSRVVMTEPGRWVSKTAR